MKYNITREQFAVPMRDSFDIFLAEKPTFSTVRLADNWLWVARVKLPAKWPERSFERCLDEVFKLCQNRERCWLMEPEVVEKAFQQARSLSVGDMIAPTSDGCPTCGDSSRPFYLVENVGWTTLFTGNGHD